MAPIPVLYFITELNVGGAERSLARLLGGLDRGRFVPAVACLYGSKSPVADDIRALDTPIYDLGMSHKWRLDAFLRLYRLLRQERPAILHTFLFHANIPGRIAGRLASVPIVISGERTMGMENRWRYLLNRVTQGLADRVVCVSRQVADFVADEVGVPRSKIVVIPNGVDLARAGGLSGKHEARAALGLPIDGALVGTVARLDPVKRLDVLLQALALVATEGRPDADVSAVLVGYGPEEERLKALAHELGLDRRIRFVGPQRDVWPWLAALDVFVLSSDWEGMSNALLEAMAARLPVVATATGGTPDVVVNGKTGFLVPPRDPAALARALKRLLGDRRSHDGVHPSDLGLRDEMGRAGRRRVMELFSAEQMVRRTEMLYEDLLVERAISLGADTKHPTTGNCLEIP
jgi:glycosyltransferase involved in cell wall biosynthesis